MANLSDLLRAHFRAKSTSAREVATRLGISYPSLLAWATKGGVPRKAEHRELLRRELVLQPDEFARVLAASGRDTIDLPSDGPLDLRQLVIKHLFERGLTERTFADISGVSYAILIGITKRGQVPRANAIELLAEKLGLPADDVRAAALRTRSDGEAGAESAAASAVAAVPSAPPTLARLAAERVAASGLSAAAFAHGNDIPYLALSSLLSGGHPPEDPELLTRLKDALGFDAAVSAAAAAPPPPAAVEVEVDAAPAHPLHAALLALVRERGWTASAFAEAAGVAQLTAAKLLRRGELPARAPTHAKLQQLLALDEAGYADLLARSRPAEAAIEGEPVHALHGALLNLVRERGMNLQAFAKAVDLGVLTATGLLKGELPGRQTTHAKLRQLLGLDEAAYAALLPEEPAKPRARRGRPPRAADPAEDGESMRLARSVQGLDDDQREAVWKLVKALKNK